MVEQRFNAVYSQRVESSKKLGSIKPLTALVHEFAEGIIEGDSTALSCIKKIQRDLYEEEVLPFEVNSVDDLVKVEALPLGDVHDFLSYVWLAYKYREEDWYWDEELHQYVSRNSVWFKI